jgi:hypothetical protein
MMTGAFGCSACWPSSGCAGWRRRGSRAAGMNVASTSANATQKVVATDFVASVLPVRDPDAAAGLLALMEGLGVYLLGGHYTAEQALGALDAHLDLLFGSATASSA